MQVIAERIGEPLEPVQKQRRPRVVRRRQEQLTLRRQHAPGLGHPSGRVGHVLDHLARPYHVECAIFERKRSVDRGEAEIERWMSGARALQGRFRDLDADPVRPGPLELGSKSAIARANVEHASASGYLLAQERPPKLEVGRRELVRKALPELLVIVLDRLNLRDRGQTTRIGAEDYSGRYCRRGPAAIRVFEADHLGGSLE